MSRKITAQQAAQQAEEMAARTRTVLVLATKKAAERGLEIVKQRSRSAVHPWWGTTGVVDTGNYVDSWKVQAFSGDRYAIVNTSRYAEVIENGRTPGARMPPSSALVPWVMRKLGVRAEDATGIAFVVAKNIARRGTPPRKIMTHAYSVLANILREQVSVETVRLMRDSVT